MSLCVILLNRISTSLSLAPLPSTRFVLQHKLQLQGLSPAFGTNFLTESLVLSPVRHVCLGHHPIRALVCVIRHALRTANPIVHLRRLAPLPPRYPIENEIQRAILLGDLRHKLQLPLSFEKAYPTQVRLGELAPQASDIHPDSGDRTLCFMEGERRTDR